MPRLVRVATISWDVDADLFGLRTPERNIAEMGLLLGRALLEQPDIVLLAESGTYRHFVAADVDLEETVFCTDNNAQLLDAIKARYGRDVVITVRHPEGDFTLRSLRRGLTVPDLIREFGLEPYDAYLLRSAHHPLMIPPA